MQAKQLPNKVKYCVYVRIRPSQKLSASNPIVFRSHRQQYIKEFREKSIVTYGFDRAFDSEHTNQEIYESGCRKMVQAFLNKKISTTVLAYGQTGSGKTYTLFGHKNQSEKGLVSLVIDDVLEYLKSNKEAQTSCYFIQIYKEKVTDLLSKKQVLLRDNAKGELVLQNQTVETFDSKQKFSSLLASANQNKIFGSSYVHNESSRSHVMFSLQIGGAFLNIVDLCGSEVLTYQFDQKQRDETNSINLSLFTLNAVISDLCDNNKNNAKKFVPFRNSVLTRLLKSSLVNTVTHTQVCLFCNIAPEAAHRELSASTLRFGQLAIQVDQVAPTTTEVINKSQQKRDLKKLENVVNFTPKMRRPTQYPDVSWYASLITILGNQIRLLSKGENPDSGKNTILILHAYGEGCNGQDMDLLVSLLLGSQARDYNFYSVDFPGFGYSKGKRFSSRAQKFEEKGEPIEFMESLFKTLKISPKRKVFLIGYDLGGAVALRSCLAPTLAKSIFGICCFHPTWTDSIDRLSPITTPTLLLWVTTQNLHLVSAGQRMVKTIKSAVLHKYNIGPYSNQKAAGLYDAYMDTVASSVIGFLNTINPPEQESNNRGQIVEQAIVSDVTKQQAQLETNSAAVAEFFSMIQAKTHKSIYQSLAKGGANKPKATKLASQLPILGPQSISFKQLHKLGIWAKLPANVSEEDWDKLPFLPVGRQVHVKTLINLNSLNGSNNYLAYFDKGEIGVTHKAHVSSAQSEEQIYERGTLKVMVDQYNILEPRLVEVSLDDVIRLNSATIFRSNTQGDLVFQDSVTCKYSSLFVKLKMLECCYAIKTLVGQMNFANNTPELLELQKECTKRIYNLIDLRHLVHEGIDNTRFTGIDVGRLAYYGQGNCHHLASVTAAFLIPFGKLLGWDVIFRAGSFFKTGRQLDQSDNPLPNWDGRPNTKVEDHTWLEVVYKPSYFVSVFDPSFAICSAELSQIYSPKGKMHIADKLHCGSLEPSAPQKLFDEKQCLMSRNIHRHL